jgi:hypothetical protein
MSHCYDDILFLVPFVDIPVGLDNLFQRIAPVYDRFYLPCLDKLFEENKVFYPDLIASLSASGSGSLGGLNLRHLQSPEGTAVAWTFIGTSLFPGTGFSTSFCRRTSGGPYCVHTTAFIGIPPGLIFGFFPGAVFAPVFQEAPSISFANFFAFSRSSWSGCPGFVKRNFPRQ